MMGSLSQPANEGPHPGPDYTVRTGHREYLQPSGLLDQYQQFDVTPVIGTEFSAAKLVEWMEAPNADELLRELAITG
jgi:hypothetical protein